MQLFGSHEMDMGVSCNPVNESQGMINLSQGELGTSLALPRLV